MSVCISSLLIEGSNLGKEGSLPLFRSIHDENLVECDETFTDEDKKLFGKGVGFRVLPYRMQDEYSRTRKTLKLKTIVVENENLKAVFLLDYGARLYSLIDKQTSRELLFCNPVLQPANLAIRNAWFSGGIEWNIGKFGHSVLTCSPLFFASLKDEQGNQFLRAYEYERMNRMFFSMDFHLPQGAKQLGVHVRIVNDNEKEIPMYWWTNIAVKEDKNLRIFCSNDDVLFMKPEGLRDEGSIHKFSRGSLSALPILPVKDPTYPEQFNFSSEYFFQVSENIPSPWEAASYDDGFTFFERSTPKLRYRKMFCWGKHSGGQNWCRYLSKEKQGEYVEIQAGMAPTQVHGLTMPGRTEWSFTQFFGGLKIEKEKRTGPWKQTSQYVEAKIDEVLSHQKVIELDCKFSQYAKKKPDELLYTGSGWGALEEWRRKLDDDKRSIPSGMLFPKGTITKEQTPWCDLLKKGKIPKLLVNQYPCSWMTDSMWTNRLKKASIQNPTNPWILIHLGVLYYENGLRKEAFQCWKDSCSAEETSIAWRNIAIFYKEERELDESLKAFSKAISLETPFPSEALAVEYIKALNEGKQFHLSWLFFQSLPDSMKDSEQLAVAVAESASELGYDEYLMKIFYRPLAYVKEGETRLVEYWYKMHARKLAKQRGISLSQALLEEVVRNHPPPREIDFMMI